MTRLLIAGIGNIFLGDDAFGCEVARRLSQRAWPAEVSVVDFGIRGMDLALALAGDYDGVILIDAAQRGRPPGTLYLIEPDQEEPEPSDGPTLDTHGMHPARVLRIAREMGGRRLWLRLAACEPATFGTDEEPALGLSPVVEAAVDEAVKMVADLASSFLATRVESATT